MKHSLYRLALLTAFGVSVASAEAEVLEFPSEASRGARVEMGSRHAVFDGTAQASASRGPHSL